MANINKAPCYKCEERHNNCHCHCEPYLEFAQMRREVNEKRHQDVTKNDYLFDVKRKRKIKRKAGEL